MSRDLLIGHTLSIYRLERLLGRGGMASVYFARDVNLQRPAAVKVMAERYRDDPAFAHRFVSEARAVASWRHEHIIQVYYAGREGDLSFFAMEYIDGMDLAALLRAYAGEGELMPHADVVQIGRAIAGALDYAHARGVIHRDVKPSNVMISTEDRVVLTDFGLALDTAQGSMGEVFGTPHYIAPEQARRSADAVPQSDLYSLGVMLYEMLTGGVPFDDPSPAAVALQHLTQPPPSPRSRNPALNAATEQVLVKALSKAPADRYPTGTAMLDALEDALGQSGEPVLDILDIADGETTGRLLSTRSVAERVAFFSQTQRTAERPDEMRVPPTKRGADTPDAEGANSLPPTRPARRSTAQRRWAGAVTMLIAAIALIGVVLVTLALSRQPPPVQLVAVNSPTAPLPTDTSTSDLPARTRGPLIVLATPEFTLAPPTLFTTEAPSMNATETAPPTVTAIPPNSSAVPATSTPPPTEAPATSLPVVVTRPAASPAPTVLYQNGRPLLLIWDDNSFYWHNPTSAPMQLNDVDFEALDATGNPLPYYFDGYRWTAFYDLVEPGDCAAIEITRLGPLFPPQCRDYNARMTPQRESDMVFWLARNGVSQFRVLWSGQEIGRCDLSVRTCEVHAP